MINTSINEAAALARKAARGAGYSWSMADEAAFAVAWLCRNDMNGTAILASHLQYTHEHSAKSLQLRSLNTPWHGSDHGLCPLSAGASFSDLGDAIDIGEHRVANLLSPALLLPFLASAAQSVTRKSTQDSHTLSKTKVVSPHFTAQLVATPRQTWLTDCSTSESATTPLVSDLSFQFYMETDSSLATVRSAPCHRTSISAEVMEVLNGFAAYTYAPATDESRQGAGAGNTDND